MLAGDYNYVAEPDPVEKHVAGTARIDDAPIHVKAAALDLGVDVGGVIGEADTSRERAEAAATDKIRRGLDERDRRAHYAEIADRLQEQIHATGALLARAEATRDGRVKEYRRALERELGVGRLDRRLRLLQLQLEAQREIEATAREVDDA